MLINIVEAIMKVKVIHFLLLLPILPPEKNVDFVVVKQDIYKYGDTPTNIKRDICKSNSYIVF
jgi:hypothetical protein